MRDKEEKEAYRVESAKRMAATSSIIIGCTLFFNCLVKNFILFLEINFSDPSSIFEFLWIDVVTLAGSVVLTFFHCNTKSRVNPYRFVRLVEIIYAVVIAIYGVFYLLCKKGFLSIFSLSNTNAGIGWSTQNFFYLKGFDGTVSIFWFIVIKCILSALPFLINIFVGAWEHKEIRDSEPYNSENNKGDYESDAGQKNEQALNCVTLNN